VNKSSILSWYLGLWSAVIQFDKLADAAALQMSCSNKWALNLRPSTGCREVHSIASAASSPPLSESSSSDLSSSKQLLVTDFWIASRSPAKAGRAGMKEVFGSDLLLSQASYCSVGTG